MPSCRLCRREVAVKPRRSEFMPVRAVVTKVLNELKQRTSEETAQVERLWREHGVSPFQRTPLDVEAWSGRAHPGHRRS